MRWYTADFDRMSWHDVHVHGFRIVEGGHGTAELQLDIDFLLAWPDAGAGDFRVAQAMLQFHEVFGLRFALDYVACSAGMTPFAIDRIVREPLSGSADDEDAPIDTQAHGPWRWRVELVWPEGGLDFEASGFTQWLVGEMVEQPESWLRPDQRL